MSAKGKHVVIGIVVLAFLLAGGNLVYRWWSGRRALEYWGADGGGLIAESDNAEAWLLKPVSAAEEKAIFDALQEPAPPEHVPEEKPKGPITNVVEDLYRIAQRADIDGAGGVTHVRKALLLDRLYDWDAPPEEGPIVWRYALRFFGEDDDCTVYLDEACLLVFRHGREHPLRVLPRDDETSPLAEFMKEQFEQPAATE